MMRVYNHRVLAMPLIVHVLSLAPADSPAYLPRTTERNILHMNDGRLYTSISDVGRFPTMRQNVLPASFTTTPKGAIYYISLSMPFAA
jgi:hypothetical protein